MPLALTAWLVTGDRDMFSSGDWSGSNKGQRCSKQTIPGGNEGLDEALSDMPTLPMSIFDSGHSRNGRSAVQSARHLMFSSHFPCAKDETPSKGHAETEQRPFHCALGRFLHSRKERNT